MMSFEEYLSILKLAHNIVSKSFQFCWKIIQIDLAHYLKKEYQLSDKCKKLRQSENLIIFLNTPIKYVKKSVENYVPVHKWKFKEQNSY